MLSFPKIAFLVFLFFILGIHPIWAKVKPNKPFVYNPKLWTRLMKNHRSSYQNKTSEGQVVQKLKHKFPHLSDQFLAYFPPGYKQDVKKKWPTIIFLHGAGERGDDIDQVRKNGLPKYLDHIDGFNFLVFSPQCPLGIHWNYPKELHDFLMELKELYPIDHHQIYLTGISSGGFGTYEWAFDYPEEFAAICPVSGGCTLEYARKLKNLPIWVFHGALDPVVSIKADQQLVKAFQDWGIPIVFTFFPDGGHDIWDATYQNPELYEWFLNHSRKDL